MKRLTIAELAWLAGILDGEGSITMGLSRARNSRWYVPHVSIVNTDAAILGKSEDLLRRLGCRVHVSVRRDLDRHLGTLPVSQIVVHHFASVRLLLKAVSPYLVSSKKRKAELMVRWVASRLPKINAGTNASRAYSATEMSLATLMRRKGNG